MAYDVHPLEDDSAVMVVEVGDAGGLRRYMFSDGSRMYAREGALYRVLARCGRSTPVEALSPRQRALWEAVDSLADGRWVLVERPEGA